MTTSTCLSVCLSQDMYGNYRKRMMRFQLNFLLSTIDIFGTICEIFSKITIHKVRKM